MNFIKLWWKTQILRKVVYKDDGKPYDCKGLRFKGSQPFGEDTKYYITKDWSEYSYLGKGKYTNWRSFHLDNKNPYAAAIIRKELDKFKNIKIMNK